jgi:hypothetical protein
MISCNRLFARSSIYTQVSFPIPYSHYKRALQVMSLFFSKSIDPEMITGSGIAHSKTQSHYENHSADSYDSAYFYEVGAYTENLRDLCRSRLQTGVAWCSSVTEVPNPSSQRLHDRILLDIGGGTGTFTRMLIQDTDCQAVVIDPFLEHQDNEGGRNDPVVFVRAPAEAFIEDPDHPIEPNNDWRNNFHQLLLKEVAHHFSDRDRIPIFRGMYNGLVPTSGNMPSLLLITRPQHDIDYPLWDEAKAVWAMNQPSVEQFISELQAAGFVDVSYTVETYPCSILLERWQAMVQARFWSTFANFTDEQLMEACRTIAKSEQHRITADGNLHFEDRLIFITASKK